MRAIEFINMFIFTIMSLNTRTRRLDITLAASEQWDLLVIGGGITGAGIALDAAVHGLKVLLLEKYDFAGGTSSRSTKLIHGGLRYLKQLEFGLVRTVGLERAVLHRLAPHLVHPVDMLLPIVQGGTLSKRATALALTVYDRLAGVEKEERFRMLDATEVLRIEPLLNPTGLIGGAIYKEYRTDDARLTMSVIKTAVDHGASCFNYVKVESFHYHNGKITGAHTRDLIADTPIDFQATVIINAAGPWVDEVRGYETPPTSKYLHLTKGVHIVVSAHKLPVRKAMYFDVASDRRMIFVIPRDEIVYVGTTDTHYTGSKENVHTTYQDVQYLIDAVHAMFPEVSLQRADIIASWAGLRPLIHAEGRSPSELSRKDEIFISAGGLISIAGGKLTGYRKMAEKAVRLAVKHLQHARHIKITSSSTRHIALHGAVQGISLPKYMEQRAGEARQAGLHYAQVRYLVHTYGTDTERIIDLTFEHLQAIGDPDLALLYAELIYGIEHEMVTGITDFFIRRTGRMYFDPAYVDKYYLQAAQYAAELLQQDAVTARHAIEWFEAARREMGIQDAEE